MGSQSSRDAQFIELLNAYRRSGGLARVGDVCAAMQPLGVDLDTVAGWIAAGEVLQFEWQGQSWLPCFQFGGGGQPLRPAVRQVLAELGEVMPAWELAHWFAQPNCALDGRTPADALAADAPAVVQAARTDRYLSDA